jgi:hypothetical protein
VEIPPPWGDQEVTRGMTPLKYFHDLNFGKYFYIIVILFLIDVIFVAIIMAEISNLDFQKLEMSWGVDIEPAYAMVNIAFGL